MYWPNLKSVAFPVTEIIAYPKKLGSPWIRPLSLFSKIFHGLLFGWTLLMFLPNLKFVAIPIPEPIAIGVLGGVRTPNFVERKAAGMVPFERAMVSSYGLPIITFPLSARVSEILPLFAPERHFFPPHL